MPVFRRNVGRPRGLHRQASSASLAPKRIRLHTAAPARFRGTDGIGTDGTGGTDDTVDRLTEVEQEDLEPGDLVARHSEYVADRDPRAVDLQLEIDDDAVTIDLKFPTMSGEILVGECSFGVEAGDLVWA